MRRIRENNAEPAIRVGNERAGTDDRDFVDGCGDKKGSQQLVEAGKGAVDDGQYDGQRTVLDKGGLSERPYAGRSRREPEKPQARDAEGEYPAGDREHGGGG